jgi:GNAT superfamily N-acetyltransferase
MSLPVFFANENVALLQEAIAKVKAPEGVTIRVVAFEKDLQAITDLPMNRFVDTMHPAYGMTASDCSDELTLIATREGAPIGHISAAFELMGATKTNLDLSVSGVFVASGERKKGIATALGKAMMHTAEAWRRQVAHTRGMAAMGEIMVSGDTEPDSGGEVVVTDMEGHAMELLDEAFDSCRPLNPDTPAP